MIETGFLSALDAKGAYKEFFEKFNYEVGDAGKYGWILIHGFKGKPDVQEYCQSEEELQKNIDKSWIFENVTDLINQGLIPEDVFERDHPETWLEHIPEEYAERLKTERKHILGKL